VGSVFFEVGAALAIEEASRPSQLLAHRAWPRLASQGSSERRLELRTLHGTEPASDNLRDPRDVRARGGLPVVERLLPLLNYRTLQPPYADDPLEPDEDLRHSVQTRLVDPRRYASFRPVRPALAIKEARGPGEVMVVQPQELDRTHASCLSSKGAKTSHKVSIGPAIFDDSPRTNVRAGDARPGAIRPASRERATRRRAAVSPSRDRSGAEGA